MKANLTDDADLWADRDWLLETKIEEAGSIALDRLHFLIQRGYRPDFQGKPMGTIWLDHPRETFVHNRLSLCGSGLVYSRNNNSERYRFGREDTAAFSAFLETVPFPSFWERTRGIREQIYFSLAMVFICIGVGIGGRIGSEIALKWLGELWHYFLLVIKP